jgi:lysophospholipase L1-like esterase
MKNRNPLTSNRDLKTSWFIPNRFFSILRIASGGALLCAATTLGLMAVLIGPSIATADNLSNAVHYYVALGDSLAAGYQPNGETGPDGMFLHGYANQLYDALKANDPTLQLQNLACGGETTSSMISGEEVHFAGSRSFCGYRSWHGHLAHGSQLDDAVAFLHAHSGFVSLITIDIGGNDVAQCVYSLDQACLDNGLATINQNLPVILSTLREAAPGVPIVGMNYYDPFLVFWFSDPTAAKTTEQMVVEQVNPTLEQVYTDYSVPVAHVETAFSTTDWTLVNGIPLNVERICEWTWMCSIFDLHPNTAGYGVIAEAFEQVLP